MKICNWCGKIIKDDDSKFCSEECWKEWGSNVPEWAHKVGKLLLPPEAILRITELIGEENVRKNASNS